MQQFFICNQDRIESKLRELIQTGVSDDGCTDFYIDKGSNEHWELTRFDTEYHGGGVSVLKRLPKPTIHQLVDIALTSMDLSEVSGASLELYERERCNEEDFRNILLQRIKVIDTSNLSEYEKERLEIVICETNLCDATNRRVTLGKYLTEIDRDANYYQIISQEARIVLSKVR